MTPYSLKLQKCSFIITGSLVSYSLCIEYEGCSKSSKPHQERRVIAEHFLLWQHIIISYKTGKTNSDFCLNFCAGEAHTKVRGV